MNSDYRRINESHQEKGSKRPLLEEYFSGPSSKDAGTKPPSKDARQGLQNQPPKICWHRALQHTQSHVRKSAPDTKGGTISARLASAFLFAARSLASRYRNKSSKPLRWPADPLLKHANYRSGVHQRSDYYTTRTWRHRIKQRQDGRIIGGLICSAAAAPVAIVINAESDRKFLIVAWACQRRHLRTDSRPSQYKADGTWADDGYDAI